MNDLLTFFYFVLGIILSVLVPIAVKFIYNFEKYLSDKRASKDSSNFLEVFRRTWNLTKPYIFLGLASIIVGFVLFLLWLDSKIENWADAVLYGYTWDSTIQKIGINLINYSSTSSTK